MTNTESKNCLHDNYNTEIKKHAQCLGAKKFERNDKINTTQHNAYLKRTRKQTRGKDEIAARQ